MKVFISIRTSCHPKNPILQLHKTLPTIPFPEVPRNKHHQNSSIRRRSRKHLRPPRIGQQPYATRKQQRKHCKQSQLRLIARNRVQADDSANEKYRRKKLTNKRNGTHNVFVLVNNGSV